MVNYKDIGQEVKLPDGTKALVDPIGPIKGHGGFPPAVVHRGGGWESPANNQRSAARSANDHYNQHFEVGLRLVRVPTK